MSKDFDWQTDEAGWNEPAVVEPERPSFTLPPWLKRWGPWLGAALILLLIIGLVVANLFDRQVEAVEDNTTGEVLAAHQLLRQTIDKRDFELLETLTDADHNWATLQLELLNVNLLPDRQPLGLELLPETAVQLQYTPTITVSADLQTAVLTERLPYQITSGERLSETVWLQHTYHYQRQGESWRWTATPDDVDYWGKWNNTEYGDHVRLIYSDRDEPFADYLGLRFDELIGRICEGDTIECPNNFHVEFRLERRPDSLLQLNESYFNQNLLSSQNIHHFNMPSPTLIGRPLQEADYDVFYQGYANWLAAVMTVRYLRPGGFYEGNPFELTLAEWGLEPPPQPQMALPLPQTIAPPPIPFPEQDILVICSGFNTAALLRYNPRTNVWQDEFSQFNFLDFVIEAQNYTGFDFISLPDDSGLVGAFNVFEPGSSRSSLVAFQDGEAKLWLETDVQLNLFANPVQIQFDRNGRKMVLVEYLFVENEEGSDHVTVPYAIDLEACQAGNCTLDPYDGIPFWSPDYRWVLLVDPVSQHDLVLQNEETGETVPLGNGFSPYWLDNETFIYVSVQESQAESEEPPLVAVLQATVDNPLNSEVLFDSADMDEAIPGADPAFPVNIDAVAAHPDQPDWLFVSVAANPALSFPAGYILAFRADTGEFQVLVDGEAWTLTAPFTVVQDGRLLVVQTFTNNAPYMEHRLIPLDPDQKTAGSEVEVYTTNAFHNDWSLDNRWLLIVEQDTEAIRLVAPGTNYDQALKHGYDFCYQATWVNSPQP